MGPDGKESVDRESPAMQKKEITTPTMPHDSVSDSALAAIGKMQSSRVEDTKQSSLTPPPSTQPPTTTHPRTRTPTPTFSHISTPPPTNEMQAPSARLPTTFTGAMTPSDISGASPEQLRAHVTELQAALHDAKMSAAHHKLQYQMLSQESATAIDRMAVEARMAQYENDIIHVAEQAKVAPLAACSPPVQVGFVPVQKDLYQTMCKEIKALNEANTALAHEVSDQQKTILSQETELVSLTDKVTLMRERICESRDQILKYRRYSGTLDANETPRSSVYATPQRSHRDQSQPFAALLQASEMMSQEPTPHRLSGKRGHTRNAQSMSSLPSTPQRSQKHRPTTHYSTPQGRQPHFKVPATAPAPRTSALRTPDDSYRRKAPPTPSKHTAQSEGTVTASDNNDNDYDSEAETDIIQPDDEIDESQASRSASQMLRSSQEDRQLKLDSLKSSGMRQPPPGDQPLRQTRLFGVLRKANVERSDARPSKRARTDDLPVGLGIAGFQS